MPGPRPHQYNRPPPPSRPTPTSYSSQYSPEEEVFYSLEDEYGPLGPEVESGDYYRPPARPQPTPASSYPRPPPTKKYAKPPIRYTKPPPARPPPTSRPYRPPQSEYLRPSQDKFDSPRPASSYYDQPPTGPRPFQKDPAPQRPSIYSPRPPSTVVPPAYNQDYYLTSDPHGDPVYPGPDIYDGAGVHGPTLGPPTARPSSYDSPPEEKPGFTYERPSSSYEKPSSSYERPSSTYERPGSSFESPSSSYERPSSSYERPSEEHNSYGGPSGQNSYDSSNKYQSYEKPGYGKPSGYDKYDRPSSPYDQDRYQHEDYFVDDNHIDKTGHGQYHPDGPDYSSGTLVHNKGSSAPFKVGVDLYPMGGVSPLGAFGKQDVYPAHPSGKQGGDNKHEILLHLNLFSKKPSVPGGRRSDPGSNSPSPYTR